MRADRTGNRELRGLGASSTGRSYCFVDNQVVAGASYQYLIQCVSLDGTVRDLATLSVTVGVPTTSALCQNYPNPVTARTTIRFALREPLPVSLGIYNVLGQRVEYRDLGVMAAGIYDHVVNLAGLPCGVYCYRLKAGGFTAVKKLVLMK